MTDIAENSAVTNPTPEFTTSAAIDHCLAAYKQEYAALREKGESDWESIKGARVAYRKALPLTDSLPNIRAFIACVAQGINFEIYRRQESTQLLYAAQVALSAYSRRPEKG